MRHAAGDDPSDLDAARLERDDEQDVEARQAVPGENLDGEESQATMPSQCARRNVFQEIRLERSGAGSIPCSFGMVWTVPRAISCPRLASASRIRVYPQSGVISGHRSHDLSELVRFLRSACHENIIDKGWHT